MDIHSYLLARSVAFGEAWEAGMRQEFWARRAKEYDAAMWARLTPYEARALRKLLDRVSAANG